MVNLPNEFKDPNPDQKKMSVTVLPPDPEDETHALKYKCECGEVVESEDVFTHMNTHGASLGDVDTDDAVTVESEDVPVPSDITSPFPDVEPEEEEVPEEAQ
jgi:hypothetical protein